MKKYKIEQKICISCGTCDVECPKGAIIISEIGKFSIDQTKCAHCGICAKVCPVDAAMPDDSDDIKSQTRA